MTWFDYALIAVVGLSALIGIWRGLVREVFALAGLDRGDRGGAALRG